MNKEQGIIYWWDEQGLTPIPVADTKGIISTIKFVKPSTIIVTNSGDSNEPK